MQISVDRALCVGHGQCEIAAPEVFRVGQDGQPEYDAAAAALHEGAVEDAAGACPMQAITLS